MSNSQGRYFPHGGGCGGTFVGNIGQDTDKVRLRDEFAMHSLSTMTFTTKPYDTTESVADSCYKMADAMMARRAK